MAKLPYEIDEKHRLIAGQLDVTPRFLFGPGPSNASPRVLQAMSMRQVGHLDPQFISIMDEIQELLRYAWQTNNQFTIPVSGTGSAAMEACFANLLEPGERIVVAINGYFGHRMVDMAGRYGADVRPLVCNWGEVFDLDEIRAALELHRPSVFAIVHAETSTGACQPMEGVGDLCREFGCLLIVDTVTSLGGVPLYVDEWKIDAAYSGSQKCLSCPPGVSPLTFNERALNKLRNRRTKVANWYLDMSMIMNYWGQNRSYHHTAPISMNYALREALRILAEEGLKERWHRHRITAKLLWNNLLDMGLDCFVDYNQRLASLTTVKVPDDIDARAVQQFLLNEFNIEIAGGLGDLAGKVWRIGMMGMNSRPSSVMLLQSALKNALGVARAGK